VRCADPGAGQHGNRQFRNHRHIDRDAVAFADAEFLERARELTDFGFQLAIGQGSHVAGFAFPKDGGVVAPASVDLQIQTVVRQVGLAADEPFDVGPFPVADRSPFLEPVMLFGDFRPELLGLANRSLVHGTVFVQRFDVRRRGKGLRRRESAGFTQRRADCRIFWHCSSFPSC